MSSVLPSLICMASRRKHAQLDFPLRTANMCNFLLQREQDTMLPLILSHPMFLREIGSRQTKKRAALSFCLGGQGRLEDDFFLFNVSLTRHSCRSGSISPLEIIPHRLFQQIRMHFHTGNHPTGNHPDENHISPLKKACPAYETGRMHSERNSMRNHRKNE